MANKQNRYLAIAYTSRIPYPIGKRRKRSIEMLTDDLLKKCKASIELGIKEKGIKGVNANNTECGVKVGLFRVTVAARLCIPRLAYREN